MLAVQYSTKVLWFDAMTTTTALLTLEEYLLYDDDSDNCYELVDGKLVVMPPESYRNDLIALYLLSEFLKLIPLKLICHKDTVISSAIIEQLSLTTEQIFSFE